MCYVGLGGGENIFKPYIIALTSGNSLLNKKIIFSMGVDYIVSKSKPDYFEMLIYRILKQISINFKQVINEDVVFYENANKLIIEKELQKININIKSKGYDYILKAICFMLDGKMNYKKILSTQQKKSEQSIIKAMRCAIERAWIVNDVNELSKYYTAKIEPDRGAPTVSEFLMFYYRKIKSIFD